MKNEFGGKAAIVDRAAKEGGASQVSQWDPPANSSDTRDMSSIPGSGRCHGEENGNPLQYSCLEYFMDRGAWWAIIHGVAKSQTRLSMHTHSQRRAHLSVNFNKDLEEVQKPARGYLRKCNQAEEQVQSPEVQACPTCLSNSEAASVAGVKRIEIGKDRK